MGFAGVKSYWELTKPRIVFLLVYTSLISYLLASKIYEKEILASTLLVSMVAITAGSAGCDAVTSYIDRNIDMVMKRTRHRPLPSGRIVPPENGLHFGLALLSLAALLSLLINTAAFLVMTLGILDNVIIYSYWLKRKNPLNIIFGGVSGGMPAVFGWVSATGGKIDLFSILLGAVVVAWIPNHIWNLALYHRKDYVAVGVPMLPIVVNEKTAVRCTASTVPILFLLTLLLGVIGDFGLIYWVASIGFGIIILVGNIYAIFKPTPKNLWSMFKLSSPYLVVVFTAMLIDAFFKI
ncbi:MAG: protoheme IX farnesyltransferase [Nitrososphaeria archaeon]|nr:protoheme IX farnesyltransferase [Nitrososphaeria archaeon]NIQ33008.1 protoheme IX farnesyltransferase [Nitrososphaeria archaeon]